MQPATICERIAEPLLRIHRNTTPVWAVVVSAVVGLGVIGYGLNVGNRDIAWVGVLVVVTSWYGFLLSGCERLLAAKDAELSARTTANVRSSERAEKSERGDREARKSAVERKRKNRKRST